MISLESSHILILGHGSSNARLCTRFSLTFVGVCTFASLSLGKSRGAVPAHSYCPCINIPRTLLDYAAAYHASLFSRRSLDSLVSCPRRDE